MPEYSFTVIVDGDVDARIDELFEAGCDDATFGAIDGVRYADFDREAPTPLAALSSAIRDIESIPGLCVVRVEPDDLVTAAEIAERLGRSRESIRLLISGERGGGDFPAPVSHLRRRNRLWRWSDIAAWAGTIDSASAKQAALFAAINAALELRAKAPELSDDESAFVSSLEHARAS